MENITMDQVICKIASMAILRIDDFIVDGCADVYGLWDETERKEITQAVLEKLNKIAENIIKPA